MSLVAVFLALGIGVVMGATVIDRVTVEALNNRIDNVRKSVNGARAENRRINGQLATIRDFADQARDPILKGKLEHVPVMLVAVTGIDRKPVDSLAQALVGSGATFEGTVWFSPKIRLQNDDDARTLATLLGTAPDRPEVLLGKAFDRLAAAAAPAGGIGGGGAGQSAGGQNAGGQTAGGQTTATTALAPTGGGQTLLEQLRDNGFAGYEAPPVEKTASSVAASLADLPLPNTRFVIVSGAGAQVGDDVLSGPLVASLVGAGVPVAAVESGQDTPGGRAVFVGLLRSDGNLSSRLSTIDNLDSPMGQAATVLALGDLVVPRFGHFGVGPGAQRLLPAPPA